MSTQDSKGRQAFLILRRLVAAGVDVIVYFVVPVIVMMLLSVNIGLIGFLVCIIAYTQSESRYGQTLGMRFCWLRVRSHRDRISFRNSLGSLAVKAGVLVSFAILSSVLVRAEALAGVGFLSARAIDALLIVPALTCFLLSDRWLGRNVGPTSLQEVTLNESPGTLKAAACVITWFLVLPLVLICTQAQLEGALKESKTVERATVVRAARDVEEGVKVTADDLELSSEVRLLTPGDAMNSTKEIVGTRAKYGIAAGQIVSTHDLTEP